MVSRKIQGFQGFHSVPEGFMGLSRSLRGISWGFSDFQGLKEVFEDVS